MFLSLKYIVNKQIRIVIKKLNLFFEQYQLLKTETEITGENMHAFFLNQTQNEKEIKHRHQ